MFYGSQFIIIILPSHIHYLPIQYIMWSSFWSSSIYSPFQKHSVDNVFYLMNALKYIFYLYVIRNLETIHAY